MLSSVPCSCSVTILLFNSSQRSLVLVKQFRPGEARVGSGGRSAELLSGLCSPRVRTQMQGGIQGKLRPSEGVWLTVGPMEVAVAWL